MRNLIFLAGLTFMIACAAPAAARDAEEDNLPIFMPVRVMAVTLDGEAREQFPGWLDSWASRRGFELSAAEDDDGSGRLIFILTNSDIQIGGENHFDVRRFALWFGRHTKRRGPDADAVEALADAIARDIAETMEGAAVSPSIPVWEPPNRVYSRIYRLAVTLEEDANERFLNRLRTFARTRRYVVGIGPGLHLKLPGVSFTMFGGTVLFSGRNDADPLRFDFSFYRNGPPYASTDEEISHIVDEFASFVGQTEGVTVSEKIWTVGR